MKALWKGSISFILVNIPIKLYSSTSHKDKLAFNLLHDYCGTPIRHQRYCPTCRTDLELKDTVHGYEFQKREYVVVTDREIQAVERTAITTSKSIDVIRFIDKDEVDPIYYDSTYYLEPSNGAAHSYALFREAMRESRKVALAKITFREREHLAVIREFQDILTLHTLFYADEVADTGELAIPQEETLDKTELSLASELIRRFVGTFDIEHFHDEFKGTMMEVINAKIAGERVRIEQREKAPKVVSLMDALRRSLERTEQPTAAPEMRPQRVVRLPRRRASRRSA